MTAARRAELENLVRRLRAVVFASDTGRADHAARILRAVRARLEAVEAPERARRDRAQRKAERERRAYHVIALAQCPLTRDEREATAHVTDLAGGQARAYRLRDLLTGGPKTTPHVIDRARAAGYTPEAVAAMRAILAPTGAPPRGCEVVMVPRRPR